MNGQDMAQRWADESATCERGHRYLPSEWGCPECEMEDEREMTKARHTPAPWTVVRLPSQFAGYAIKEAHERIKTARENGGRWNEEAEANRMLIEATPKMRELLVAFLAAWDSGAIGFWVERDVAPFRAMLASTPPPVEVPVEFESASFTDPAQGALFDLPAPKPPSAIAEGR